MDRGQSAPFLMRLPIACLAALAAAGLASVPASAQSGLPANKDEPQAIRQDGAKTDEIAATLRSIKLPPGFKIALFAIVPDARGMAVSADGRKIFVGTAESDAYVLDLKTTAGPVASAKTFAPSIEKTMPHGVCFGSDGTLYLAEQNRILAFADAATKAESPDLTARVVVPKGKLIPRAYESRGHSTRVCRIGPDGDLYVSLGQPTNVPTPQQWQLFSANGLGAIIRMKTDGSGREIFAGGIRNSAGLDFNPADKSLWFTDNQVDMMGDDIPPGEINRATKAGETFGFPWYGGGHVRTNEWKTSTPPKESVFPQVEMQAHAADLGMSFYRGTSFPERYRGGIFSAQHGSWNRSTPVGARVMFTPVSGDKAGKAEPFASGWIASDGDYKGRPAGVAELKDGSLLVADDANGAIYRITYAPPQ